jgi:hypothetical protein
VMPVMPQRAAVLCAPPLLQFMQSCVNQIACTVLEDKRAVFGCGRLVGSARMLHACCWSQHKLPSTQCSLDVQVASGHLLAGGHLPSSLHHHQALHPTHRCSPATHRLLIGASGSDCHSDCSKLRQSA